MYGSHDKDGLFDLFNIGCITEKGIQLIYNFKLLDPREIRIRYYVKII